LSRTEKQKMLAGRIGCDVWIGAGAIILPKHPWPILRGLPKRLAPQNDVQALRFPRPAAMESGMFARRTISISSPASA
jgi:hypothetical protein